MQLGDGKDRSPRLEELMCLFHVPLTLGNSFMRAHLCLVLPPCAPARNSSCSSSGVLRFSFYVKSVEAGGRPPPMHIHPGHRQI